MKHSFTGRALCLMAFLTLLTLASPAQNGRTNCEAGTGPLDAAPPKDTSIEAIIQKFAAEESRFKSELSNYSYVQDITVQTLNGTTVNGEFRRVSQISWEKGAFKENVTFSPQSTLQDVSLSPEDFDDIYRSPFILTTENLPQYNIRYEGQQKVDEIETYVFETTPKALDKGKRYFQGRVWVDRLGGQIVMSCGKTVPDEVPQQQKSKKKGKKGQPVQENVSPTIVTYREQFNGNWFPTYLRADETLHFQTNEIHIREVVKRREYQRSGAAQGNALVQPAKK
ncbi:MAG TPA: hypothetical protein VE783_04020 [Candidatus Limnocylindrales bacterium]|nr:hypothetical protein [Candidatus Limnocylindrales bacterium]